MLDENKNFYIEKWLLLITILVALMIIVGGLTRLTDSGLSITKWDLISGVLPPLSLNHWEEAFNLYKKIPEYKILNSSMTLEEFKVIFWWEYIHRLLGRIIGLFYIIPLVFFTISKKLNAKDLLSYYFIFFLICLQGFIGWYMVSSGLIDKVDVSHYRLALHLIIAFFIFSLILWYYLKLKKIDLSHQKLKLYLPLTFLILVFLQITLGAFVSGMDAGTLYNSWPLMGPSYFPDDNELTNIFKLTAFSDPSLVQFFHRNLAYIILIYYLILVYKIHKNKFVRYYNPIKIIGLVLFIQIVFGIFTLLSGAQIYLSSIHQISSIFLVSLSVYFLYLNSN